MAEAVSLSIVWLAGDVGLPGRNGYEVARRLRAHASGRRIALIALTGYGQLEDRRLALEAGFDTHLVKPVDADELYRAIEAVLGAQRSR